MLYPNIGKEQLKYLYETKGMSMMQISKQLNCSHHKIAYWMFRYGIARRQRSQASYLIHNPAGDPFKVKHPQSPNEYLLLGLGIGLYWGEGTKSNKNAVRLGNSDPGIIRSFMAYLERLYCIDRASLRFGLQIFSDVQPKTALQYWSRVLNIPQRQFYKPIVTKSGSIGSYRNRNEYGVVTIYFNNTKLRNILMEQIAEVAQWIEHPHGKREVTGSIPVLGSS